MCKTTVSLQKISAVLGLTLMASVLGAAQQTAPPATVKTAAEIYKNIQVLKDIPSNQIVATMRFVATSLGVECEFCHLGDRAEETDNKKTARKMMTMMLALDKQSFDGRLEVTCYTCHNGHANPSSAPPPTGRYSVAGTEPFYKPTGPRGSDEVVDEAYVAAEAKMKADLAASLPSADQIVAKYVAALGGEQALRKVTVRKITATAEMHPRVGPALYVKEEGYFKAPNLYVATLQMDNGQTAEGFDGADYWTQNTNNVVVVNEAAVPNGVRGVGPSIVSKGLVLGAALARAKRDADFYESLDLKQEYTRLTVRGIEKVGDHDAYVVVGTPQGDNPESLYFDVQTALLLRKVRFDATALGNYTTETDYDDYRDAGGVKVPFLINTVTISPADSVTLHVETVENDPPFDAARFTKPISAPKSAPARQ